MSATDSVVRTKTKDAVLPPIRCDQGLRERLDRVVGRSIAPQLSVHLRRAVEQYVEAQEQALRVEMQN